MPEFPASNGRFIKEGRRQTKNSKEKDKEKSI
jgi:hypothetical protein